MKSYNNLFTAVLALSVLTFSVACTQGIRATSAKAIDKAAAPAGQNPLPSQQGPTTNNSIDGTTDGGGGNSINGRMIESYIIAPEELPVVKQKLSAIIKMAFSSDDEEDNQVLQDGNMIFKFKTWYLVPMSLKHIQKKALGIEFAEGQTEQVAIQTKSEVWINSLLFDKMTEEEQAKLILHEAVMTYYLTKFLSFEELCAAHDKMGSKSCSNSVLSPEQRQNMSNFFKPEVERSLNAQDYNSIRYVTSWLWKNGLGETKKRFDQVALAAGFDKRFKNSEGVFEDKGIEISTEKLIQTLEKAKYHGDLTSQCLGLSNNASFKCEIQISYKNEEERKELTILAKNLDTGEIVMTETFPLGNSVPLGSYSTLFSGRSASFVSPGLFKWGNSTIDTKPGTRGYGVTIDFDKEGNNFRGIRISPLVYTGKLREIETRLENDKEVKYDCESINIVSVNGAKATDQPFAMGDSEVIKSGQFTSIFMGAFKPFANCKKIEN